MDFTVATSNVLATAYIKPEWYPLSPKKLLEPRYRIPALIEHLVQLGADIFCLQEVEDETYTAMDQHLFHDRALRAEPLALPTVNDTTPLPGPGQPSDHVAVLARLAWRT